MKKIIFTLFIFLMFGFGIHCGAQGFTDMLDNYSLMESHSDNLWILKNSQKSFQEDAGRAAKYSRNEAWFQYKVENVKSMRVRVFGSRLIENDELIISASTDGENYTNLTAIRNEVYDGIVGYGSYDYIIMTVPEETRYIRIDMMPLMDYAVMQVGEVEFLDESIAAEAKGILFEDDTSDFSKVFWKGQSIKKDGSPGFMRKYMIDASIKYYLPDVFRGELKLSIMDGTGDVEVWYSADDIDYEQTELQVDKIVHDINNWHHKYVSFKNLPSGTQYIKIVLKSNDVATWTPVIRNVKLYH